MKKWGVLVVLGAAQFLMVLDQAVMNVAISQLVEDFDTTVTTIQTVIAFYALVMAGLMLTGGKLGDIWGRRRAFTIGICIYAVGSGLTAASWSVPSLMLGWSVLEGIGAALVLPALVALVAGNYRGADRAIAYGVLGGVAGAGIAVGPILGGWATTELSWRVVFVGEVVVAIGILARHAVDPRAGAGGAAAGARLGRRRALGRGPRPGRLRRPAGEQLGLAGAAQLADRALRLLADPVRDRRRGAGARRLRRLGAPPRTARPGPARPPPLLRIPQLRGGVAMLLAQNLILMGIFFTIPLFLQIVQGLDALETGVRMLPASAGLFFAAIAGSALAKRFAPRPLVRAGLAIVFVAILLLLATIEPELDNASFLIAMGVLGIGMGLIVSQLGNVVQSAVGDDDRSEAGGLQNTAQQLGSSLGTALLGAIVITGLIAAFTANVADDARISADVSKQLEVQLSAGGSFVAADEVRAGAEAAGLDARDDRAPWSRTTKTPS